jgi:membrane glycosyltransferase
VTAAHALQRPDANVTSDVALVDLDQLGPVPPEAPLDMPVQRLDRWDGPRPTVIDGTPPLGIRVTRLFVFGLAGAISFYGIREMVGVVSAGGIVGLEWPLIVFFAVTFSWIALSAASGIAGFFAGFFEKKAIRAIDRRLASRTALLMPVYNESPARTIGAL